MLVKLNYTSDTSWKVGFRILNHIITDSTIVSTSTLQTFLVNGSASASLTTGLDYVNSDIKKITTLTNTVSHWCQPTSATQNGTFTLRQTVYDTTGTYFYYQIQCPDASGNSYTTTVQRQGTTLSSGNMFANTTTLTAGVVGVASGGPAPVINTGGIGYYQYSAAPFYQASLGMDNIRCFWFYVTDTCFLWALTLVNTAPLGFSITYSNPQNYCGPWYFGQYTRYDYFNTNANGVIPYCMSNDRAANAGLGFGATTDWDNAHNTLYNPHTIGTNPPWMVYNMVSALPKVGTSWPLLTAQQVNWGVGPRYDEVYGLTASGTNNNTRASAASNPTLFTTVSTRFPSADLASTGFAMLPILWRESYYGNTGGNTSAQTGVYIFNGDYFPGDEYTYNGITYKIWPVYAGYSNRIGLAVPKQ
jgi:tetrahydromethanopterin S-methyltransferase subunit B